jgi:hypothetical protein
MGKYIVENIKVEECKCSFDEAVYKDYREKNEEKNDNLSTNDIRERVVTERPIYKLSN